MAGVGPESSTVPITLRVSSPGILANKQEKEDLISDLRRMGCEGFIHRPWELRNEKIVRELLEGVTEVEPSSIRGVPNRWSTESWRRIYQLPTAGLGLAARTDKYHQGKFLNPVNSKDGFVVVDCEDRRERRVLEFMVSLLYPEKPT